MLVPLPNNLLLPIPRARQLVEPFRRRWSSTCRTKYQTKIDFFSRVQNRIYVGHETYYWVWYFVVAVRPVSRKSVASDGF